MAGRYEIKDIMVIWHSTKVPVIIAANGENTPVFCSMKQHTKNHRCIILRGEARGGSGVLLPAPMSLGSLGESLCGTNGY